MKRRTQILLTGTDKDALEKGAAAYTPKKRRTVARVDTGSKTTTEALETQFNEQMRLEKEQYFSERRK